MTRPTLPRIVTLLDVRDPSRAPAVVQLNKQGRTYYAAQHVQRDVDTGDRRLGYTVRIAIAEVRVLEGERWDLIETWRAATMAYQSAVEQWYKDREAAGREAIRQWVLAHPFPAAPTIEAEAPLHGSSATLEASMLDILL